MGNLGTGNLAEVMVVLGASLFGYLPVTEVQLPWINLVTDSGPAVALGIDPPAPALMRGRPQRSGVISRGMLGLIIGIGMIMAAIILATFALTLALYDLETAQTATFTAFVVQEYLRLWVIRRQEGASFFSNRWLLGSVALSLALQMGLVYSPLGDLFSVVPLSVGPWLILLAGLVLGLLAALGITRVVVRRLGAI